MTDVHTKAQRSYNMSQVKSKDTKPELLVRKFVFSKGFRYRVNYKKLPGKPDIVFVAKKKVIFIHGCFWHGHKGCSYATIPKTRTAWWETKINGTKERDLKNAKALKAEGWKILNVFECDLKSAKREKMLDKILKFLE